MLFSVADGHGLDGDKVSHYTVNRQSELVKLNADPSYKSQSHYNLQHNVRQYLYDRADDLQTDIVGNDGLDTTLSGSTLCSILLMDNKVYCSNTGDSGAILVKYDN